MRKINIDGEYMVYSLNNLQLFCWFETSKNKKFGKQEYRMHICKYNPDFISKIHVCAHMQS